MKKEIIYYTLKVWLTDVGISPVLFALILIVRQEMSATELLQAPDGLIVEYIFFVAAQLFFTAVVWFLFMVAVHLVMLAKLNALSSKSVIFIVAIAFTIGICELLLKKNDVVSSDNLINLMCANCIGIGWGVWYYSLPAHQASMIEVKDKQKI